MNSEHLVHVHIFYWIRTIYRCVQRLFSQLQSWIIHLHARMHTKYCNSFSLQYKQSIADVQHYPTTWMSVHNIYSLLESISGATSYINHELASCGHSSSCPSKYVPSCNGVWNVCQHWLLYCMLSTGCNVSWWLLWGCFFLCFFCPSVRVLQQAMAA